MSADLLSEEDVRDMLRAHIAGRSLREAGQVLGVSAPWLCMTLKGQRRPCGKVLDAIGIARQRRGRGTKALAFTKKTAHE